MIQKCTLSNTIFIEERIAFLNLTVHEHCDFPTGWVISPGMREQSWSSVFGKVCTVQYSTVHHAVLCRGCIGNISSGFTKLIKRYGTEQELRTNQNALYRTWAAFIASWAHQQLESILDSSSTNFKLYLKLYYRGTRNNTVAYL